MSGSETRLKDNPAKIIKERLAALSPEKRGLLLLRLKQKHARQQPRIVKREDQTTYPLSYAQQRLWFLNQFDPESAFYNVFAALRISGNLNVEALEWSLNEVIRRHEVLRANFSTEDGYPVQKIKPQLKLNLSVTVLSHLPPEEREAEISRLASAEAKQPFDLSNEPLIRARLFRLDADEYVLFLSVHHIVFDGWSTRVLIKELAALYAAFSDNLPSPLPELSIQYADYAQWQKQWLQEADLQSQLFYWREKLGDIPPYLELPTDYPRPPVQSYHGGHFHFWIPNHIYQQLRNLSQEQDVTLFMTLLAAFKVLLHRYAGQADISIGVPIANRRWVELEQLIGFFVNTLVMRTAIEDDIDFLTLLSRVRSVALEAYANQDVPFEMLVDELQPERDMSHTPLFQVMFDLQEEPLKNFHLGSLQFQLLDTETEAAKFDLMLMLLEEDDGLKAIFEYNTDLFTTATIRRMAAHYQILLEGIVASPETPVARLPLLSAEERRLILQKWNDTTLPYPGGETLHHLFERQVERSPEATAVVYGDEQLTYQELNRRANQLAHHLVQLNVKPGSLIGVCLERSVELMVGVLGILKAGCAYLPLDPSYPLERLEFMLVDAHAPVLVSQTGLLTDLPTEDLTVIYLDTDEEILARQADNNPDIPTGSGEPAYIIYTSGSTGKPKGVLIPHRGAIHLATALNQIIYRQYTGRQLRLSLNAPLSFDASVQQVVMLIYGHTLYIIPQEVRQDGRALLAYIRRHRLNGLDCVPSQLKLLLSAGLLDEQEWAPEIIMPGGEAIDAATWQMLAAAPRTEFYNMYGPTECSVDSTIGWVRQSPDQPTIGRPVSNARLYVLDRNLQPVPIGIPGELCIGGAGVGLGYLNRPNLTAEKFIPDPFSQEPDARLYRTGDLVRYLPDGNVEFLGRMDNQVKVHGYRIELGEIDAVLSKHPDVKEAVTIVREDAPGEKRLVAYLLARENRSPNTSELRRYLKKTLPEYMVPIAYVILEAFPLTPNGKINRRALPAPEPSRPELDKPYISPRSPAEQFLADLWQQVLKIEKIGVEDNFFELGGDSIRAAVLINKLQAALDCELNVRVIFRPLVAADQPRKGGASGDSTYLARSRIAAFLCPAEVMVPRPTRSRQPALQYLGGYAHRGFVRHPQIRTVL